uniref:C2H2-type domain-containing protein n=1 Tax=Mola mola TaxID=94237 RepID=A0A3Q3X0K7_MOLML
APFYVNFLQCLSLKSSTFICTECGDGFSQYSNVLAHMAIHGPLESFSFDGSSNGFEVPREYVLQENGTLTVVNGLVQSHSPVKPMSPGILQKPLDMNLGNAHRGHYHCEICSRSFNSLQSLHRHQQYRNMERGYKCTLCCKIFEGRQDLTKHLQDHTNERFYCCSLCGKRFLKVDALNAHKKEKHLSPKTTALGKSENKQEKKVEKTYPCKKCKLNFFWLSDFQAHSLYHCNGIEDASGQPDTNHSFTPYRCGLCGDRFEKLTALKEHHLTHQTQEEIDQLNEESQRNFKRRMPPKGRRRRSNPNGKLHPCKHCHRVFNHSSSLSRHMRYHKGTMHTCVFCGRHFPQRCDLRRHIAMYHKAELEKKPGLKHLYTNPQNGPAPNSLNGEKNTFTPEEKTKSYSDNEQTAPPEEHPNGNQSGKAGRLNYKCQECGKKFGLLCVYQRHLRYHKKEPSKCPRCPAQFKNSSSLELHLQNHPNLGENEDDGQTCQDPISLGDTVLERGNAEDIEDDYMDLAQNEKGNPSEVLYECTECTETFSCLETFLQHQSSHGSENNR